MSRTVPIIEYNWQPCEGGLRVVEETDGTINIQIRSASPLVQIRRGGLIAVTGAIALSFGFLVIPPIALYLVWVKDRSVGAVALGLICWIALLAVIAVLIRDASGRRTTISVDSRNMRAWVESLLSVQEYEWDRQYIRDLTIRTHVGLGGQSCTSLEVTTAHETIRLLQHLSRDELCQVVDLLRGAAALQQNP